MSHFNLSLGAIWTFYYVPKGLRPVYGDQPISLDIYLRLVPLRM